jgi:very-short-patch-repair endonuclease
MMRRDDDLLAGLSNFYSTIEWPHLRPPTEPPTGELTPISSFVLPVLENIASATAIAPECESPIEVELGARLSSAMRVINDPALSLVCQYRLGPYRYDFAIIRASNPLILIECDGSEFHSTEAQLANDRAKDDFAAKRGMLLLRFSGSEIFRDAKDCVRRILQIMRDRGHITLVQYELAFARLCLSPKPLAILAAIQNRGR